MLWLMHDGTGTLGGGCMIAEKESPGFIRGENVNVNRGTDMNLNELLVTAGGIGIVVKLVLDVVKSVWTVNGRTTQGLAIALGVTLGVFGGLRYLPGSDIAQSVWLGLQAGAAAIGIDQITKRSI